MKQRLIYLGTALAVLVCALVFTGLEGHTPVNRVHQHREQPGESELPACAVCGGEGALCTHLPIIRIETGGQKIPGCSILDEQLTVIGYETGENGEERILADISTVETAGSWHHPEDTPDHSARAYIRYRGDTSRVFRKHNFQIELVEDEDPLDNRDLPLMGMEADNEWALHGPFLDKTLVRNYVWMNLSAEVMGSAPDVRFCELVLDGEYQGLYVLMETNTRGVGRIPLTEYTPDDPVCSYILRITTHPNPLKTIENFTFYTERLEEGSQVEVLYPTASQQTDRVKDYIRADVSEIERMLYAGQAEGEEPLWKDELDQDSFVDYLILQEFLGISDAFNKSTYFYRDVRGKLHIGPVWDYNNALDNFFRPVPAEDFLLARRSWYAQLLKDEDFVEAVIRRYRQLREGVLSDEQINAYLDETIDWLGSAVDRNFEVWGYSFDTASPLLSRVEYRQPAMEETRWIEAMATVNPELAEERMDKLVRELNPTDFDQAVEWMRDYTARRGGWLDEHIDSLRQYCAPSKNAEQILQ